MSQSLERVEKDGWEIEGPKGELSKARPLKLKSRKSFPFRVPARQEYVQLRVLVTKRGFFFNMPDGRMPCRHVLPFGEIMIFSLLAR